MSGFFFWIFSVIIFFMNNAGNYSVDISKVHRAVQAGLPLTLTTYKLPHEMEIYMGEILAAFLREIHQEGMIEYLTYCLSELVGNAKKANTKRVYFKERGLNVHNRRDYLEGMKTFKADTLENIKHFLDEQEKQGLYIRMILQKRGSKVRVEVRNNASLSYFEYVRIHDKMSRAQQYKSVDQALKQLLDDSEGAGLGLVIMILMMKKLGLSEECYQVLSERGETISRLVFPVDVEMRKSISMISAEFVNLIDELPQFPENIVEINKLLDNPQSKMSDIAEKISNDVSLTADLLRTVNAANVARSNRCRSIGDAVKFVGIRGVKNMLFSIGSIKNLTPDGEKQTARKKELWTHAYKTAFYSYNIARNLFSDDRECVEDSYVCGLLHDMGKIIFETSHPDVIEKLKALLSGKGISAEVFEKLIAGVDHSEIGALIAEKWNFPESIVGVIRYHHEPDEAPEKFRNLASVVYLSDMILHYQDGEIEFDEIDCDVLSRLRLSRESQLKSLGDSIQAAFAAQASNNPS